MAKIIAFQKNTPLIVCSFLIPRDDYAIIRQTLQRLDMWDSNRHEVVRMALKALETLTRAQLKSLYENLEPIRKE